MSGAGEAHISSGWYPETMAAASHRTFATSVSDHDRIPASAPAPPLFPIMIGYQLVLCMHVLHAHCVYARIVYALAYCMHELHPTSVMAIS